MRHGVGSPPRHPAEPPRNRGVQRPDRRRYELTDYAADIESLRLHLGLERINLLGHSHGGMVSMVYALEHADGLDRLILACTAPRFSDELREEAQNAFAAHCGRPWYDDSVEAQRRRRGWEFTTPEQAAALYAREVRLWFGERGASEAFLDQFRATRPNLDALHYFNERLAPAYDLRLRRCEYPRPDADHQRSRRFLRPARRRA